MLMLVWWVLGITYYDIPVVMLVGTGIFVIPMGLIGLKVALTGRL